MNWKINLIVRMKNKAFWLTFIPALFVLVATILQVFGITADFSELTNRILAVVEAVFGVLAIIGITNDPTTYGFNDSNRAMTYTEPYKDEDKED